MENRLHFHSKMGVLSIYQLNAYHVDASLWRYEMCYCLRIDTWHSVFVGKSGEVRPPWWRHNMEKLSALMSLCEGNIFE